MRKILILLLCLLLVLPFSVYAENTENQPAAQTESQPEESKPAESRPEESKPAESQPEESKPAESQPEESKPAESQPEESKPSESQPAESKPTESQPAEHTHVWDVSYTVPATCQEEGATAYGCSACGAVSVEVLPKLGHKFGTQWTRNASGHWHACSACGEKSDFGKHYPGPAATEEKAQICLTCGYTLTAKLGHSHKYETQWTSDETGHWYACSGCDEQKDFADHSYDDGCDPDCNVCGYLTATAHKYSGTWSSDENGHWDVCTICQKASDPEPHIPDPEAGETEAQVCLACGFELAPAPESSEHVHAGEGNWQADGDNHWKVCSCGDKTDVQPHRWDSGEEQADGTMRYTCEDCSCIRTVGKPQKAPGALVWICVILVILLAASVAAVLLLIFRLRKAGKYGK